MSPLGLIVLGVLAWWIWGKDDEKPGAAAADGIVPSVSRPQVERYEREVMPPPSAGAGAYPSVASGTGAYPTVASGSPAPTANGHASSIPKSLTLHSILTGRPARPSA